MNSQKVLFPFLLLCCLLIQMAESYGNCSQKANQVSHTVSVSRHGNSDHTLLLSKDTSPSQHPWLISLFEFNDQNEDEPEDSLCHLEYKAGTIKPKGTGLIYTSEHQLISEIGRYLLFCNLRYHC